MTHGRLRLPAISYGELSPEANMSLTRSPSPNRKTKSPTRQKDSETKTPIPRPSHTPATTTPVKQEEVSESAEVNNVENATEEKTSEPTN